MYQETHTVKALLCWNVIKGIKTNNTFIKLWLILISIQLFLDCVALKLSVVTGDMISSFSSQHKDISYWKKNECMQTICPQRGCCSDYLILRSCFLERMHTWVLLQIYIIKSTWLKRQICADKQVHAKTHTLGITLKHIHTHFSAGEICMPGKPEPGGDNKSHFRHVCQVSRQHLSSGWMWGVGSESSKQGHRYPVW